MTGIDGMLIRPLRIYQLRELINLWYDVRKPASGGTAWEGRAGSDLVSAFLAITRLDLEQLRRAADASDWPQMSRLAHRIAGAAMMFELSDVIAAAKDLEALAKSVPDSQAIGSAIEQLQRALSVMTE